MQLTAFQVQNYRSINDSGKIDTTQRTALVGRNESGKTSLLLALESLNPPDRKLEALSYVKDFPRDRPASEFSEDLPVVRSWWKLTPEDRSKLTEILPRAKDVTEVTVVRLYKAHWQVGFTGLPAEAVDQDSVKASVGIVERAVGASLEGKEPTVVKPVTAAFEKLKTQLGASTALPVDWATKASAAIATFRQAAASAGHELPEVVNGQLTHVDDLSKGVVTERDARQAARNWVTVNMPIFIYQADYPELEGHQNITKYLERVTAGKKLSETDANFTRLMKVAGLDAAELNGLLASEHEKRQQLSNRAGAVVTKKVRELWKDRKLKVRFNLDAEHFDTLVSDPESVYDVEINLNERSRGFKWFFSFYVTFSADTAGGPAEQAVLLFDEPALYLHAVAQRDLLDHFKQDFKNTIIYTTHSPFMIPIEDLGAVRTVNIAPDEGTTVTNDPTGDAKTLFPLQTALGYELSQTLFIGDKNLVVEGVSDFWYVSAVSDYLVEQGGAGLPRGLVTTPAGGAQKVSYMVSLLTSHKLKVLVLLDSESQSRRTAKEDLVKTRLIREEGVIFVSDALGSPKAEADIEDLLDPAVYDHLVQEVYKTELTGKQLKLNAKIPRIVRRYEDAFDAIGLPFHKTRPARLFLQRIAAAPATVLPAASRERFEKLFKLVGERLKKVQQQATFQTAG
jgi:energy-coupling factor transporter ATP-binding protein EcfA2